jgi:hypothetical protein
VLVVVAAAAAAMMMMMMIKLLRGSPVYLCTYSFKSCGLELCL